MVKQGSFARSSKQKQLKQIKRKFKQNSKKTIDLDQVMDFVLVRYGLTLKKHFNIVEQETMQRFLMEFIEIDLDYGVWDLEQRLINTLKKVATKVPWQFYQVILVSWPKFQNFLQKEMSAIPTKEPIIIDQLVEKNQLMEIIARQLSVNFYLLTLGNNATLLAKISTEQVNQLAQKLIGDSKIDWAKVSSLFKNDQINLNEVNDLGTKQWLEALMKTN